MLHGIIITCVITILIIVVCCKRSNLSNWLYNKYGNGKYDSDNHIDDSQKFIIISSERLKNIFLTERNRQVFPYFWILSAAFTLLICWVETISFNSIGGFSSDQVKTAVLVLSLLLLAIGIFMFIRALIQNKNLLEKIDWDSLLEEIQQKSNNRLAKNIIFLFVTKEKDQLKFIVERKASWNESYFFPHIDDYFSDNLNQDKKVLEEAIKATFSIPQHMPIQLTILPKIELDSIKNNAEKIPQQFHFRFIFVSSKFPFLNKSLNNYLLESTNTYEYKSIPELIADKPSFSNNRDVIEQLQSHLSNVQEAFKLNIEDKPAKIIWNIDKRCKRGCAFCAYGNTINAQTLTLTQKKKIVDSLRGIRVSEIDFAVGDDADIVEVSEIIRYTHNSLPRTTISLTATSKVLEKILSQKKNILADKKIINCVDISIDTVNSSDEIDNLRFESYNESNLNIAKKIINRGKRVKIQTVITANTSYETVKNLIYKLKELGIKEILLLRMMPVGKMSKDNYPPELVEKTRYEELISKIQEIKDFKIRLHCSLRGLNSEEVPCNMGCQKLGIAMNGDLFTCPWAEHLPHENNPFRLGNLRDVDKIEDLLIRNDRYKTAIENKNLNQPHCKIFSFVFNEDAYGCHDVLYK